MTGCACRYLLDDVGTELLLGQNGDVVFEATAQRLRESGLTKVNFDKG